MAIFENIFWLLFVLESSQTEAYIFHGVMPWVYTKINRHTLLTLMRGIVFVGIFGFSWQLLLYLPSHILMFPFIHDGIYYQTRNNLNHSVYPLRFRDRSTTTDARFSFGYETRKRMFLIGIVLWITSLYIGWRLRQ